MAEEKKDEAAKPEGDKAAAPAGDAKAEGGGDNKEIEVQGKKSKVKIFAGIGLVVLLALGGGGFFVFKKMGAKKVEVAAKTEDGHGDGEKEEEKKDDAHGGDKKEEKDDGHGEKKDDAHGDKTADGKKLAPPHCKPRAPNSGGKPEVKEPPKEEKKEDTKKDAKEEKKDDAKKEDHGKEEKKDGKEAPKELPDCPVDDSNVDFGETYNLPKLDINLGNPLENRFVRIGISIEYRGGEGQMAELRKREPQLRDIVITSVGNRTRLDLLSEKGKNNLRREVLNKFNEVLQRPITTLYFTDLVVE